MGAPLALVPRSNAVTTRRVDRTRRAAMWSALAAAGAMACWLWPAPAVPAVFFAFSLWFVAWEFVRGQREHGDQALRQADVAAARGDLAHARDIYFLLAERASVASVAAKARGSLAWTVMRQGEFAYAIELLEDNDTRNFGALRSAGHHAATAANLALVHAL